MPMKMVALNAYENGGTPMKMVALNAYANGGSKRL